MTRRIEWIVVSAVLVGLLAGCAARSQAKAVRCASNLHQIGIAIAMYQASNKDTPPASLEVLFKADPSLDPSSLRCPAAKSQGRTSDYFYLPPDRNADPLALVACDLTPNHSGKRNCLYADMHVASLTEAAFQQELAKPLNAAFAEALRKAGG